MVEIETLVMHKNLAAHAAAVFADEAEAKRLCEETQRLWDSGHSFIVNPDNAASTLNRLFGIETRQSDSQEEIDAAVSQLETQLAWLAIRKTISQMSREECAAFVHTMERLDTYARINVLGQEFHYSEIWHIWNKSHPNELPVYPEPAFES